MTTSKLRFLLLQVRNPDDPMRQQEIACFSRALRVEPARIGVVDLLARAPMASELATSDMVLLGGSGDYSVTSEEPWLYCTLDALRELHAKAKPTFASCWGFQAFARAMGGRVMHDMDRAELGTHSLRLTASGKEDPLFSPLGETFEGQMGHEDCVDELPPGSTLLASSGLVVNQAYRFDGLPIYCTQFHAELNAEDLRARAANYPTYIEHLAGMSLERFSAECRDTPNTEALLRRFVEQYFGR